jgi:hypothetical protein
LQHLALQQLNRLSIAASGIAAAELLLALQHLNRI